MQTIVNYIILFENERFVHEDTERIGSVKWNMVSSSYMVQNTVNKKKTKKKNKQTNWGIRLFAIAEHGTCYIHRIIPYMQKKHVYMFTNAHTQTH